jgi:hypothetical protein
MKPEYEPSHFFLAEEALSLKHVFDNVRNYLICASFFGLALWLTNGAKTLPADLLKTYGFLVPYALRASIAAGAFLSLLNGVQSVLLLRRGWEAFRISAKEFWYSGAARNNSLLAFGMLVAGPFVLTALLLVGGAASLIALAGWMLYASMSASAA